MYVTPAAESREQETGAALPHKVSFRYRRRVAVDHRIDARSSTACAAMSAMAAKMAPDTVSDGWAVRASNCITSVSYQAVARSKDHCQGRRSRTRPPAPGGLAGRAAVAVLD